MEAGFIPQRSISGRQPKVLIVHAQLTPRHTDCSMNTRLTTGTILDFYIAPV